MHPACLPQVSSSPLTQKISFLTGKGLTDSEVQQALAQAASGGSSSSPPPATAAADASKAAPAGVQLPSWQQQQGPHQVPYPPYGHAAYSPAQGLVRPASPSRRDWRDYFVSARHPRRSRLDAVLIVLLLFFPITGHGGHFWRSRLRSLCSDQGAQPELSQSCRYRADRASSLRSGTSFLTSFLRLRLSSPRPRRTLPRSPLRSNRHSTS